MRHLIRYYKWHLLFSLVVLVCITFIFVSLTTRTSPDMTIGYTGTKFINRQMFNDNKSEIELLLHDANEDGKKTANFVTYTIDMQKDINETFSQMIESEEYDIYIASRETFESCEDKNVFVDASSYIDFSQKELETLEDASGRIYATSLTDNSIAERLGVVDPTGLYIAAAADKDKEPTAYRKNGRNLAGYIVDNKSKYR